MIKKIFVLMVSLFFLFGGGLCSFFLLFSHTFGWILVALILVTVALWSTYEAIQWLKDKSNSADRMKMALTSLAISIFCVVLIYWGVWSSTFKIHLF